MKWTLLIIFVISLAVGITHAASVFRKTCPRGQTLVHDQCVTTPTPQSMRQRTPHQQAPPPTPPQVPPPSGSSTCPLGQVLRNGKCSPKQCPAGMAVNGEGKCDCTRGYRKENNRCVSLTAASPAPCPNGRISSRGNCVTPTPSALPKVCPKDHRLNESGKCAPLVMAPKTCVRGQRLNRKGNCIPIVAGQSCGKDLWINEQGQCGSERPNNGCPAEKERNRLGNCVRKQICTQGQIKDETGVCHPPCPANQERKSGKCVSIEINNVGRG